MKNKYTPLHAALIACGMLTAFSVNAAPLTFAQSPAGSIAVVPPAPNLILTIDNSNSMNNSKPDPNQVGSRMENLRSALTAAFSSANVPANSIRLGWNMINPQTYSSNGSNWGMAANGDCSEFRTSSTASFCGAQGNIVRPFTEAHRTNFLNWVTNGLRGVGNTPTLHGYYNALRQYDLPATNVNSPWAEVPGERAGDYLTCRKSYVMLLTDGDYNRFDNAGVTIGGSPDLDNRPRTLGDGTAYDPTQPYANIYRQSQNNFTNETNHLEKSINSNNFNTLSDLAFHYWAKDIDGNAGNNNGQPKIKVANVENGISSFWNPKNNPATWQHVSTYTIGYGATASGWATSPRLQVTENLHNSADLQRLMTGSLSWPNQTFTTILRQQEMMHAAINGRGKFYPARTQQDLIDAIKDMLTDVIPVPEQHVTSATGSTLSGFVDSSAFYTSYDSDTWSGDVSSATLLAGGGVSPTSPWGANTAASLLNARNPTTRNILTSQGSLTGTTFTWAALSTDQQTALRGSAVSNATTNALGQSRLNYLRGDRTGENTTVRKRESVLGDIVNSSVWFMKGVPNAGYLSSDYLNYVTSQKNAARPDTIFVGSNDGMLHAFSAQNGNELFAYVPQGAYANLAQLADPAYTHKYFVDGSPFTADFCKTPTATGCTDWSTALVGFMGAGGKGYVVLDVANPNAMSASKVLIDTTASTDADLGYIFQKPVTEKSNAMVTRQITRMNDGKWALVTGNGYNSTSEKAVLIIQYLDGTTKKIEADGTLGGGNGLSAPRLIDLDGDNRPDVAYAGDLKGHMYKFDLTGASSNWKVAGNTPMFTARSPSNAVQPITTAPVYMIHPSGGLTVVFGTGQNLTIADRSDVTVQSFYGLYDNGFTETSGGITVAAASDRAKTPWSQTWTRNSDMVSQSYSASGTGWTTTSGTTRDANGDGIVDEDFADVIGSSKRGWFMDLTVQRERALRNPTWFEGELLFLFSDVPAMAAVTPDPCQAVPTSPASYYRTVVNGATGNKPQVPNLFVGYASDVNRVVDDLPIISTGTNDEAINTCVGPDCDDHDPKKMKKASRYFKVPSWREMQ